MNLKFEYEGPLSKKEKGISMSDGMSNTRG